MTVVVCIIIHDSSIKRTKEGSCILPLSVCASRELMLLDSEGHGEGRPALGPGGHPSGTGSHVTSPLLQVASRVLSCRFLSSSLHHHWSVVTSQSSEPILSYWQSQCYCDRLATVTTSRAKSSLPVVFKLLRHWHSSSWLRVICCPMIQGADCCMVLEVKSQKGVLNEAADGLAAAAAELHRFRKTQRSSMLLLP